MYVCMYVLFIYFIGSSSSYYIYIFLFFQFYFLLSSFLRSALCQFLFFYSRKQKKIIFVRNKKNRRKILCGIRKLHKNIITDIESNSSSERDTNSYTYLWLHNVAYCRITHTHTVTHVNPSTHTYIVTQYLNYSKCESPLLKIRCNAPEVTSIHVDVAPSFQL